MIVPNKFFHTKAATELRTLLADQKCLQEIVDFGDSQVFRGPTNYSCMVFLDQDVKRPLRYTLADAGLAVRRQMTAPRSSLTAEPWHFESRDKRRLFEKMEAGGVPLQALVSRFGNGVQSGADRVLMIDPQHARELRLERGLLRPILRGRDVRRYAVGDGARLLVFPYKVEKGDFAILPESQLEKYKHVYDLLCDHQGVLESRIWFGKGPRDLSGEWYGMMYLDGHESFATPHLLTPSLSNRANFALGQGTLFATGTAGVTSIIRRDDVPEQTPVLAGAPQLEAPKLLRSGS